MADGLQMALHDNAATQKSGFSACGTRLIHEPGPRVFSLQRYSPHSVVKGRRYLMVADQGILKTPSSSTVNWSWCSRYPEKVISGTLLCFQRGLVINELITFDHVQQLSIGRAKPIHHGQRTVSLDSDGVYDQRLALVMSDGISIPGGRHLCRMRLIQAHVGLDYPDRK